MQCSISNLHTGTKITNRVTNKKLSNLNSIIKIIRIKKKEKKKFNNSLKSNGTSKYLTKQYIIKHTKLDFANL